MPTLNQHRRLQDQPDPLQESLPEPAVDIVHNLEGTVEDVAKTVESIMVEGLEDLKSLTFKKSPKLQQSQEPQPEPSEAPSVTIQTPEELKEITEKLEERDKEKGLPEVKNLPPKEELPGRSHAS